MINLLPICDGCGFFVPGTIEQPSEISHSHSWGWSYSGKELGALSVKTADTLMCLGRGEVAELLGLYFEIGVGIAKFVIFQSAFGQQ